MKVRICRQSPFVGLAIGMLVWQASPVVLSAAEPDPGQTARDYALVEALMRLPSVDVSANPKLQQAVTRYLKSQQGTPRYLDVVERLSLKSEAGELLKLALAQPDSTEGVSAGRLLFKFGEIERLLQSVEGADEAVAVKALDVMGRVGNARALDLVTPLVTDKSGSLAIRSAAVAALGRNVNGQRILLAMVEQGKLPTDLEFAAANVLYASPDGSIREAVGQHLTLPSTVDEQPLPPVAELVKRKGNVQNGQAVFLGKGTCNKCHKLTAEGKEVGPSLAEIGSKLSREALYISILDPNAGIAHSFESYALLLASGNIVTGLLVSETDDQVTIKNAEAIAVTVEQDDIDEMVKQKISLMPSGLQKTMSIQDLVDLVEFLGTLKKKDA